MLLKAKECIKISNYIQFLEKIIQESTGYDLSKYPYPSDEIKKINDGRNETLSEPIFLENYPVIFSVNYPVTFEDKGLRAFLQENFEAYFTTITLTDEELDQFKRHLEASISDWICENWRDFTENRGD